MRPGFRRMQSAQSSATPAVTQANDVQMVQTTNGTTSTATSVPAGSTLSASFSYVLCNTGTVVNTVTPTTSTINSRATLVLQGAAANTNPPCFFSWTDASNNYWAAVIPGTDANGRLAAASMPALTGDCTTTAGALALTINIWIQRPGRSSMGLLLILAGLPFYRMWARRERSGSAEFTP